MVSNTVYLTLLVLGSFRGSSGHTEESIPRNSENASANANIVDTNTDDPFGAKVTTETKEVLDERKDLEAAGQHFSQYEAAPDYVPFIFNSGHSFQKQPFFGGLEFQQYQGPIDIPVFMTPAQDVYDSNLATLPMFSLAEYSPGTTLDRFDPTDYSVFLSNPGFGYSQSSVSYNTGFNLDVNGNQNLGGPYNSLNLGGFATSNTIQNQEDFHTGNFQTPNVNSLFQFTQSNDHFEKRPEHFDPFIAGSVQKSSEYNEDTSSSHELGGQGVSAFQALHSSFPSLDFQLNQIPSNHLSVEPLVQPEQQRSPYPGLFQQLTSPAASKFVENPGPNAHVEAKTNNGPTHEVKALERGLDATEPHQAYQTGQANTKEVYVSSGIARPEQERFIAQFSRHRSANGSYSTPTDGYASSSTTVLQESAIQVVPPPNPLL